MISINKDYSYLLDDLKRIIKLRQSKRIVNDDDKIKYSFAINYLYAYQYMLDTRNMEGNNSITSEPFSDYKTFNSFINECIKEYSIYDEFCTGKKMYFPNHEIAEYMLYYQHIVYEYLKLVLGDQIEFNDTKRRVKA